MRARMARLGRGPGNGRGSREEARSPRTPPAWDLSSRRVGPPKLTGAPVTERLYNRLDELDVAAVHARLQPDEQMVWTEAAASERQALTLAFGLNHDV